MSATSRALTRWKQRRRQGWTSAFWWLVKATREAAAVVRGRERERRTVDLTEWAMDRELEALIAEVTRTADRVGWSRPSGVIDLAEWKRGRGAISAFEAEVRRGRRGLRSDGHWPPM